VLRPIVLDSYSGRVGVYFVSVDADDWANGEMVAVRHELGAALQARGAANYDGPPPVALAAGGNDDFEEKLTRPSGGFARLLDDRFSGTTLERILYWSMTIPVVFDEPIVLATPSVYQDTTIVGSSFALRTAMAELARAVDLPGQVPHPHDSFDIGDWFYGVETGRIAAPPGAWRNDLDTAFFIALFLRSSEYSIRRSCPMRYI
jgi:hypothetical protein